jgi:CRISPR-associated exonuclease Cas4
MFSEDDLLPLSALQHSVYCPRQAALIHLERAWADNALTAEGTHLHERADSGRGESRGGLKILRAVPLRSLALGLTGRADVIELRESDGPAPDAARVDGRWWHIRPVEYKRGRPKRFRADEVQLCAQALCLEEMFAVRLTDGDLFYGATRRRTVVALDASLRELTAAAAAGMHAMFNARVTPPAVFGPRCRNCSLIDLCKPEAAGRSARRYLRALFRTTGEPS